MNLDRLAFIHSPLKSSSRQFVELKRGGNALRCDAMPTTGTRSEFSPKTDDVACGGERR
jgi:hypothetical protein